MTDPRFPRTLIEKLAARHAVGWDAGRPPAAGDFLTLRPRHVMTHDNTSAVIAKFNALAGADAPVADPAQPVFAIDHDIQNHTPANLAKYAAIRAFAERRGIAYHPPGRGIAHQVMIEEGLVRPGTLVVGSDSHSNMYGALACLGTPVVRTDAAGIWLTGTFWWTVPPQVRVTLTGELPDHATGKDVILTLCSVFSGGEALNAAVEFAGEGLASLSVEDRMTIANMSTEWGAVAGVFPFDDTLRSWLYGRVSAHGTPFTTADVESWWADRITTDPDARFARELTLDLSTVSPHVSGPNSVTAATPAADLEAERIRIDKAYLMSCVNARLPDLEAAASVFGADRRVAEHVEFYIAAASSVVEAAARESGAWGRLLDAGAIPFPPGCGACIGLGAGTLEPGEVGISATNRNFEGRMGSRDAACYLASPAVVAESAIQGSIAAPRREPASPRTPVRFTCRTTGQKRGGDETDAPQRIAEGFPPSITGRSLLLTRDHINTDGIYGKDVTYRDDIRPEDQGRHAFLNYDPGFQSIAQPGDILVAGENFGCGSSREQAATCLLALGIRLVIAASVGQTFQRNAFNNALIVLECPAFAQHLRSLASDPEARTLAGPSLAVDFESSTIACEDHTFRFTPLTETAQTLIAAGGLEPFIASQLDTPAPHTDTPQTHTHLAGAHA